MQKFNVVYKFNVVNAICICLLVVIIVMLASATPAPAKVATPAPAAPAPAHNVYTLTVQGNYAILTQGSNVQVLPLAQNCNLNKALNVIALKP